MNFSILTLLMSDCEKELFGLGLLIDFMISLKVLESFVLFKQGIVFRISKMFKARLDSILGGLIL